MKRIFMIATLMLTAILTAQTASWTGTKTFGSTLKFANVLQNNANTRIMSLDATGKPGWVNKDSIASIPTFQQVLKTGFSAESPIALTSNNKTFFTVSSASLTMSDSFQRFIRLIPSSGVEIKTNTLNTNNSSGFIKSDLLDSNRNYQLPNNSGTIPLSVNGILADNKGNITITSGGNSNAVSATETGVVDNISLQELGGVDKTINGIRIGRGSGNQNSNTALGRISLLNNTTGGNNTAIGAATLFANTSGNGNTAVGTGSLSMNTGSANTAVGASSMTSNLTGGSNVAIGSSSLQNNKTGDGNVAIGPASLYQIQNGFENVAIGFGSGGGLDNGSNNTFIGRGSFIGSTFSNTVLISAGTTNRLLIDSTGKTNLLHMLNIANTPVFIDNTAAISGGLVDGDVYRTSTGVLMITLK